MNLEQYGILYLASRRTPVSELPKFNPDLLIGLPVKIIRGRLVTKDSYQDFIDGYNEIMGTQKRGDVKSKKQFGARIKEGWLLSEILQALKNARKNDYHMESGYQYLTPEFITRSDKLDKFYTEKPKSRYAVRT